MTAPTRTSRVVVNGYWIHPFAPHGTENGYKNWKCRCKAFAAAHAVVAQRERAERAARSEIVNGHRRVHDAPHGTTGGYSNYGCRCDLCRDAKAASR
jgi:hypothetical protein